MNTNLKKLNKKIICVTIGDIDGIGIHLLIKEFLNKKINNFVLITNYEIFNKKIKFSKNKIQFIDENNIEKYNKKKLNIYNIKTKNKNTNTIDSLKLAYKLTKRKYFIGILTLPLNKNKINKFINRNFIDQTTFFSNLEKKKNTNMVFFYKNKFFIPLTIHIELKKVYQFFKDKEKIETKIKNIIKTLKNDFMIKKPKLIISGINPHAGENQIISKDENKYLIPIIKKLKKNNVDILGPVSGDGMVNDDNLKNFDAFVFTYHDQALIPFKIISKYKGVNFTSNLNIIRVSPSHGTAENLVGSDKINSKGIINCFKLINKIYNNRN